MRLPYSIQAVDNTRMLATYSRIDPRVKIMGHALKCLMKVSEMSGSGPEFIIKCTYFVTISGWKYYLICDLLQYNDNCNTLCCVYNGASLVSIFWDLDIIKIFHILKIFISVDCNRFYCRVLCLLYISASYTCWPSDKVLHTTYVQCQSATKCRE